MARYLAVALLAVVFVGITGAVPGPGLRAADSQAGQRQGASPQLSDADRKFTEITKPGRQSEQIKRIPQLEQFIRDYPDYPRLEMVYATLLSVLTRAKTDPERLQALAEEALAKFIGEQNVRSTAYFAKFSVLTPGSPAFKALGRHILDTETSVLVLKNAAEFDKPDAVAILEIAIDEQTKRPRTGFGAVTLDSLRWSYAGALADAGRTEEALRSFIEIVDATARRVAEFERAAGGDSEHAQFDVQRELLADRCSELVARCISAGKRDVALRYLKLQLHVAEPLLDGRPDLLASAARMYEQLGRPELALDGFVRAMARRMDPSTRDQIVRLARKTGKSPEDFYRRARGMRVRDAKPAYPFALVTADGQPMKLANLKARAILISFFFPT
jgi:tetratricopeptide (TPR) repeat protein